jgi:hypothetical protein
MITALGGLLIYDLGGRYPLLYLSRAKIERKRRENDKKQKNSTSFFCLVRTESIQLDEAQGERFAVPPLGVAAQLFVIVTVPSSTELPLAVSAKVVLGSHLSFASLRCRVCRGRRSRRSERSDRRIEKVRFELPLGQEERWRRDHAFLQLLALPSSCRCCHFAPSSLGSR